MKIRSLAAVLAASLILGGCTAVRVCHVGKSMVDVENNGWFLFDIIPLASGDTEHPESKICRLFQNSVTLENNIDLIDYAVKREGAAGVRDLVSYASDEYVLFFLLKRHSMHTSAVLVMPETELEETKFVQKIDSRLLRDPEKAEVIEAERGVRAAPVRSTYLEAAPMRTPTTTPINILNF